MKKVLIALTAIVALVALTPSTASAQATGDVDVAITVNGIVILYYYDDVSINIPSSEMALILGLTGDSIADTTFGTVDAAYGGSALSVDPGTPPTGGNPTLPGTVPLTITNAWAVRGLMTTASSVDVTVSTLVATLDGPGTTGSIGISSLACAPALSCTGLTPTLATANSGDVTMDLDFSTISNAATFAATTAYTITATVS
jgi:hypothetical protein